MHYVCLAVLSFYCNPSCFLHYTHMGLSYFNYCGKQSFRQKVEYSSMTRGWGKQANHLAFIVWCNRKNQALNRKASDKFRNAWFHLYGVTRLFIYCKMLIAFPLTLCCLVEVHLAFFMSIHRPAVQKQESMGVCTAFNLIWRDKNSCSTAEPHLKAAQSCTSHSPHLQQQPSPPHFPT